MRDFHVTHFFLFKNTEGGNKMENIRKPSGKNDLIVKKGKTIDIQKVILEVSKDGIWRDTKAFSTDFKATYNGLWDLWKFVKHNIEYIEDPEGVQWVKDPARLYADGSGDCKSFTLFIVSVLQNLKVPYTIRFASYEVGSKKVTHVYPVAHLNGQDVILDAVWYAFDSQKKYEFKQDFKSNSKMAEIYRLSGFENTPVINTASMEMTAKQLTEAAKNIPNSVLENDITQMTKAQFARFMGFNQTTIEGIGNPNGMAFVMPVLANHGEKIGGILSKVKDAISNAWKKIVNWVFKVGLTIAAPYFLYTFIKTNVSLKIDAKRAKQMKILNWISSVTGTPIDQLLMTIAASIQKKTGKSPNEILRAVSSGKVGSVALIVASLAPLFKDGKIIENIKVIISKIVAIFKKAPVEIDTQAGSDLKELESETAETERDVTKPNNDPAPPPPPQKPSVEIPDTEKQEHVEKFEKTTEIPKAIPVPVTGNAVTDETKPSAEPNNWLLPVGIAVVVFAMSK